eukprot:8076816-Pyramimonas_sp.AAC.1
MILGKTGTRDSGCEGTGTPSLVGSVRTGDAWRVCAEAAAEAAPGDARLGCPTEERGASADVAVGLPRPGDG